MENRGKTLRKRRVRTLTHHRLTLVDPQTFAGHTQKLIHGASTWTTWVTAGATGAE
jgi:hypothetical protein